MNVFKNVPMAISFPQNIHPSRHDPKQVLKRFEKAMRKQDFRPNDEAWLLIDIDSWDKNDIKDVLDWAATDKRYHVAISNPKFELFLIMHFGNGNGCTTPSKVDSVLKQHMPKYKKRLSCTAFSKHQICQAVENAERKRKSCNSPIPDAGMTDVYLLVKELLAL